MAIASFNVGLKTNLPSTLDDGAIYVLEDTGELYYGNGNSGVKISDIVTVATYADLPLAPLSNKFYYVIADVAIYKYEGGQWHSLSGGGGSVSAGVGLEKSGSTIKAKLLSETALNNAAAAVTEDQDRLYPIYVDSNGKLAVVVPWTDTNTTYENKQAAQSGTDVSLVTTGDKYNWNNKTSNNGTVTQISASDGLVTDSGSDITNTGTVKANLVSYTKLSSASAQGAVESGKVYSVVMDSNGKLAVPVPWQGGGGADYINDPTSVATDKAATPYLVNHLAADVKTITIPANGWSNNTVTINNIPYYTYSPTVTKVLLDHPTIALNISSLPTSDQNAAFDNIEMIANKTNNTVTFYTTSKPSIAIPIVIRGVV